MGEIVPFPVRSRPVEARLHDALQGLTRSIETQRKAIAEWQATLLRLQQAMCSLDNGMQTYQRRLDQAGAGVAGLRKSAVGLEALADAMLQRSERVSRTVSP
jgi:hypothetical protein